MSTDVVDAVSTERGVRTRVGDWVEAPFFSRLIIALIIINGIILGLDTSHEIRARYGEILDLIDHTILAVFVFEISLKLFAHGFGFFRVSWNIFDIIVVGIALAPSGGQLSVLRVLRILRVLRLISQFKQLRIVVEALLGAIGGIASIAGLMLVMFYVFAVIATNLFGQAFPEWFGTLGRSFYTLFQVMTLESWSMGISRPVMEVYPWAWAFFVPFILTATFTMLNLFIAVIVNSMSAMQAETTDATFAVVNEELRETKQLEQDVQELKQEVRALVQLLSERNGSLDSK
ncbi:MAG: ion transporter [Gallionellaceae bacterium]